MTTRKNSRPPVLHIQRLKNRVIEELHQHDSIINHFSHRNQTQAQFKNTTKPQATKLLPTEKSLDQSIIMLDSPSAEQIQAKKKNISNLSSGLKIMKVQCSWNTEKKDVQSHALKKNTKNKSFDTQPAIFSRQKINPEVRQESSSKGFLKDPPLLKNLKTISFKRQTLDTEQLERDPIKEQSSKNPESITDSSLNKNESNRRIILSEQSESPFLRKNEASSILSAFLPIDSNVKQNLGSEKKILNNQDCHANQNASTPEQKFKKKTAPSTLQFVTKKKQVIENRSVDAKTLNHNKTSRIEQVKKTESKKQGQKKAEEDQQNSQILKLFDIQVTPQRPKYKEELKGSKSSLNLSRREHALQKSHHHVENKQSEQFKKLRNAMTNQKNLKLKDYLRLASLSNDSKFDLTHKLNKNENNLLNLRQTQNTNLNIKKSFIFDKNRTAIDSEKSITLIKQSLRRKLEKSISSALKLIDEVGQDKQLVGSEYEDLVFMCNFHKILDENLFKTVGLLEDLLNSYKNKRLMGQLMEDKRKMAELKSKEKREIKELFSPVKRGKKRPTQTLELNLIQKILMGFNIISTSEIKSDKVLQN